MNIMPQLFVQIKENKEIFRCPQCKRILFYREEAEAPGE
jgi:predicted  nucleic acid-binding Zn-ribbon protein